MSFKKENISYNEIQYPNNIICKCSKEVIPQGKSIDSSTWDLICDCGEIAYKHPKRELRIEQLSNMLDF